MPLVANMRFDMFVSYAHVDNESMDLPGASNAEGWVSRVVRMLKISVAQRQGDRRFEVWLDSQHHDTGRLDELLKERIAQSGILLAIVSRGYLNSRYCLLEFDHFMSSHDAFKNRVVIVDTQDVFEDPIVRRDAQDKAVAGGYEDLFLRVVDECSRQKRMPFFQVTGPGRADPIDYTHGESASHDLRRKVADLAFNLSGKIDELKQLVKGAIAASAARVEIPASRIGVMVALSKESLKPRRDDIVRFLESRREIHVLPEDESLLWPHAETREAFDARVREALKQAEIFVQLIGAPRLGEDGTLPVRSSELPDDFVRLQLEVAEELEKQPIIWCTPNLMNSDLTQVERDIRRKRSVIEDTIETLKRQIDTNVARLLKEKAKPAKSPAAADEHSVFFNYVHAGRDLVRPDRRQLPRAKLGRVRTECRCQGARDVLSRMRCRHPLRPPCAGAVDGRAADGIQTRERATRADPRTRAAETGLIAGTEYLAFSAQDRRCPR
jgi:hypothetical protein